MKKMLFPFLLIVLFLWGCGAEDTPEIMQTMPAGAAEIGSSSYRCITGESEQTQQLSDGRTAKVKAFAHRIYNPNGEYVVTLTTAVTGVYSPGEDAAEIVDVSHVLSDAKMDGVSVSGHFSGDTATVVVYLNKVSVCHFQYRLSPDGTLEFL